GAVAQATAADTVGAEPAASDAAPPGAPPPGAGEQNEQEAKREILEHDLCRDASIFVKSVVPIWGPEQEKLAIWLPDDQQKIQSDETEDKKKKKQLRRTFQRNDED
ncbi:unnamed protein product, partial [Amoebophrya sp. A25]